MARHSAMLSATQMPRHAQGRASRRTTHRNQAASTVRRMLSQPENRFVRSHLTAPASRVGGGSAGSMVSRAKAMVRASISDISAP